MLPASIQLGVSSGHHPSHASCVYNTDSDVPSKRCCRDCKSGQGLSFLCRGVRCPLCGGSEMPFVWRE